MTIIEKIKSGITYCDGGAGTLLQSWGLKPGEKPETWNITNPDKIIEMHRLYLEAGANIIVAGSAVFKAPRVKDVIDKMKYAAELYPFGSGTEERIEKGKVRKR